MPTGLCKSRVIHRFARSSLQALTGFYSFKAMTTFVSRLKEENVDSLRELT
ncbi:hypothetical protein HMPREF3227_01814, partial [Corynebacterium sp. CMW7794]